MSNHLNVCLICTNLTTNLYQSINISTTADDICRGYLGNMVRGSSPCHHPTGHPAQTALVTLALFTKVKEYILARASEFLWYSYISETLCTLKLLRFYPWLTIILVMHIKGLCLHFGRNHKFKKVRGETVWLSSKLGTSYCWLVPVLVCLFQNMPLHNKFVWLLKQYCYDSVLVDAAEGDNKFLLIRICFLCYKMLKNLEKYFLFFTLQLLANVIYIVCLYNFCDCVTWYLAKTSQLMLRLRILKYDSTVLLIGWLQNLYSSFGCYIHHLDSNHSEDTGWSVVYLHSINRCIPGSSHCCYLLSCSNMVTREWTGR